MVTAVGPLTVAAGTVNYNSGETVTKGLEFGVRGDTDALRGKISGGFDLSSLLEKKSRLLPNAPFGASEVGQWTRSGDLGIRIKHTAFISYRKGNWTGIDVDVRYDRAVAPPLDRA